MVQTHIGNGYPEFRHACPRCGESWSNEVITIRKWQLIFCTIFFSSKFTTTKLCRYISKGIWIAMNVSLETSFRMSVRPVEKVFCFCLYSFSCYMLFMLFFFWQKIHQAGSISQTTHVTLRAGNARCVSILSFCPTSDSSLVLFVTLLISINPICPTSDLIIPNWYIPDFRSWRTLATSTNALTATYPSLA